MCHFISVASSFCRFYIILHDLSIYNLMKLCFPRNSRILCVRKLRGKLRKRLFCATARINERMSRRPIDCTNSISPAWSRLFPDGARVLSYCESRSSLCGISAPESASCYKSGRYPMRRSSVESLMRTIKNIDTMLIAMQSIDISWPIDRDIEIYIIARKIV